MTMEDETMSGHNSIGAIGSKAIDQIHNFSQQVKTTGGKLKKQIPCIFTEDQQKLPYNPNFMAAGSQRTAAGDY